MSTHSKASLSQLHKRFEELLASLPVECSSEALEIQLVHELIIQRTIAPEGGEFSAIRSTRTAVFQCLTERRGPMTKQEIYDRLVAGGFPQDPVNGQNLLGDNINYLVKTKQLVKVGNGEKREMAVALPKPKIRPK